MSIDATTATWKLQNITAIQKLLLLSLADRADEVSECWPSLKRLEEDTSLNRKTIIENRQLLLDKRLISYTGEMKGRQRQIPVMRLNYVEHREGKIDLENDEFFTSTENGTGPYFGTGTSTENGTGNQYRKRDTESKRSFNLKEEPNKLCAFDRFWEMYPKKTGRKPCQEKWKKLKLDGHIELILGKLSKQIKNDDQWVRGFIPNPLTYLNQERWDDEVMVKKAVEAPVITLEERSHIDDYYSQCRAQKTPQKALNEKISNIIQKLTGVENPQAREILAVISKAKEMLDSAGYVNLLKNAAQREKHELSAVGKNALQSLMRCKG